MTWQGKLFMAAAVAVGVLINLLVYGREVSDWVGPLDAKNVRDWLGALSGWAALLAAGPTIYYLKKQVDDADRHQRTTLEFNLRRETILAKSVIRLADDAAVMLRDADGQLSDVSARPDFYREVITVLEGETISAFETEIAVPKVMRGKIVAGIVNAGIQGDNTKAKAAPVFVNGYFAQIRTQAMEFLADVRDKTSLHK